MSARKNPLGYLFPLGYDWTLGIKGGVHCADCGTLVVGAWVRRCDNRAVCEACAAGAVERKP